MKPKSDFVFAFPSFPEAIKALYRRGQEDETLEPIVRIDQAGGPVGRLLNGDVVIFYDIRGEREIELTRSLTEDDFCFFPRPGHLRLHFVTMVNYSDGLNVRVAFPQEEKIDQTLVQVVSEAGLRLAKIAESEKAPHLGYFFNGKREDIFPGEERIIIPSLPIQSGYDEQPAMRAKEIAQEVISRIYARKHNLIVANLANVDVIGHSENKEAIIKAVETVDECLGEIATACRQEKWCLVITSDHGTVEEWLYPDGAINTGHTKNPVPFILCDFSQNKKQLRLRPEGELADVAPTVLELLGIVPPEAMTGKSLLEMETSASESSFSDEKKENERGQEGRALSPRRAVWLILDGWGMREETYGNLIAAASTPQFDFLWQNFLHARLQASGEAVGLPPGTVGNSEAGHLHLGAGRRVWLDRVRIDRAIADGSFFQNKVLTEAMNLALSSGRPLHLMGIVSHYSSHGTIRHLFALLKMARQCGLKKVYLHAFVGRRGERPESGVYYINRVEEETRALNCGELVTVMGRFWALDREENWDRIEKAYRALVEGQGIYVRQG